MTARLIRIAVDFSPNPAGRFRSDGPFPGEKFRDDMLIPALQEAESVTVDLDGATGYGSSFLEEAFGGLVRKGLSERELKGRLLIRSSRASYEQRIWNYIQRASSRNTLS